MKSAPPLAFAFLLFCVGSARAQDKIASPIVVKVDHYGHVFWDGALLSDQRALDTKILALSKLNPMQEITLRPDNDAHPQMGRLINVLLKHGIHVSFVTAPPSSKSP